MTNARILTRSKQLESNLARLEADWRHDSITKRSVNTTAPIKSLESIQNPPVGRWSLPAQGNSTALFWSMLQAIVQEHTPVQARASPLPKQVLHALTDASNPCHTDSWPLIRTALWI